jgi:hypothetical protein
MSVHLFAARGLRTICTTLMTTGLQTSQQTHEFCNAGGCLDLLWMQIVMLVFAWVSEYKRMLLKSPCSLHRAQTQCAHCIREIIKTQIHYQLIDTMHTIATLCTGHADFEPVLPSNMVYYASNSQINETIRQRFFVTQQHISNLTFQRILHHETGEVEPIYQYLITYLTDAHRIIADITVSSGQLPDLGPLPELTL